LVVYFAANWYIFRSFGKFCGHLVYFSRFGTLRKRDKNLATLAEPFAVEGHARAEPNSVAKKDVD
jgi:hypothetical protein